MKVIKPLNITNSAFSRASVATYYNSTGILTTAAVDELRLGYDPSTLAYIGPIYEGISYNLILHSNSFTNAIWEKVGSPLPTITANAAVSPDGTNNASLFSWSSGTSLIRQSLFAGAGPAGIFSVYVKAVASNCSIRLNCGSETSVFRINPGDFSALSPKASIQQLQNGWFRCSLYSRGFTSTQTVSIQGNNGNFYIYGAQVENIVLPSSYDPPAINYVTSYMLSTTTAGFRAKDIQNNPPALSYSNISENDFPEYNPAATYTVGNKVMVRGLYNRNYESLSAGNMGNFPPSNPDKWLDTGATNRWRMFDNAVGAELQSVATEPSGVISVGLLVPRGVDSVVLLNVAGSSATIVARTASGETVGEYSQSLLGLPPETGWWDYFFGVRSSRSIVIYTGFSLATEGTITVTIEGGGEPARLGKLIVGSGYHIGCAKFGTAAGIIDFSRKERDPFGNNVIVERRYIDKCEYDILIDTDSAYEIKEMLASMRAIPAVYIGSENHLVTVVFGFFRDFSIVLQGPKKSACSIQAEGI